MTEQQPVIHLAGLAIHIGPLLRQRCAWCGAVLIDENLTGMMSTDGSGYSSWTPGALVSTTGDHRAASQGWIVEHEEGAHLPDGCCGTLDPAVTL